MTDRAGGADGAMEPSVFAVVLNYRHPDDTMRAVESLRRSTHPLSLVVVDNGSTPDQLEALRRGLGSDVSIFETGANLGYAGGNNVGIRSALDRGADFVWIVNPDAIAFRDTLAALVETASTHPEGGIFGSRIYDGGTDPKRIWFDGGQIVWGRGGATKHLGWGKTDGERPATGAFSVDYVTGAAMLVRAKVFADIGLLPEEYFLYFEETDFNVRAHLAGWSSIMQPDSRLDHFTRSAGLLPEPHFVYYFIRNRIIFGTRYTGQSSGAIVRDLERFIASWGGKVTERAPTWRPVYDRLVTIGIEDGSAGRLGRRDDIHDIPSPNEAR